MPCSTPSEKNDNKRFFSFEYNELPLAKIRDLFPSILLGRNQQFDS